MDRRNYVIGVAGVLASMSGCLGTARDGVGQNETASATPNSTTTQRRTTTADATATATRTPTETATPEPTETATEPGTDTPTETGTESPAGESPEPSWFEVVDVVDDLNADPTGTNESRSKIEAAVRDGVIMEFPPGQYRFDRPMEVSDVDRIGFVGKPSGEARLLPPEGFNDNLIETDGVGGLLFSGIDVDVTAPDTTAGFRFFCTDRLVVQDVEIQGRGTHPDTEVVNAFSPAITEPGGAGVLRNVRALKGSTLGNYKQGRGRVGVWVGAANRGTISIENCRFEEFGNNGLYCSRTRGDIRVIGGLYRNNNVSSVRISGEGSYVDGARIRFDLDAYTGSMRGTDTKFFPRGIVLEQGRFDKPGGVEIRNCDIHVRPTPGYGLGVDAWSSADRVTVRNTRIRIDDRGPAIHRALAPSDGTATSARRLHLENVDIVGTGSGDEAIKVVDAPGTIVRNCDIDQRGGRDGIRLVRSAGGTFENTTVRTGGYPLVVDVFGSPASLGDCLVTATDTQFATRSPLSNSPQVDVVHRHTPADGDCVASGIVPDGSGRRRIVVVTP